VDSVRLYSQNQDSFRTMLRSTSDDARGSRLKAMFASSRLSSSSDGSVMDGSERRASRLHKRTDSASEAPRNPQIDTAETNNMTARRHKSYSSLEKLRPSTLAKLSMSAGRQISYPPSPSKHTDHDIRSPASSEDNWGKLLHHGSTWVMQSSWRHKAYEKHEYLVLTDKYLLRFKNAKKAAEKIPWVLPVDVQMSRPSSPGPSILSEVESMGSEHQSQHDSQSSKFVSIPLQDIIAVQRISESPSRVQLEIQYTEDHVHPSSVTFFLDRHESEPHWLESIGDLARQVQKKNGWKLSKDLLDHVKDATSDDEIDLQDEKHSLCVYFVNRRNTVTHKSAPSPTEESSEVPPTLLLLVNAKYKMYLLSLKKRTARRHSEDRLNGSSFGFVNLVSLEVTEHYEATKLAFRSPQQPASFMELDSVHSAQIALQMHERVENLVPSYLRNPFMFRVPAALQSQLRRVEYQPCTSIEGFSSTLKAYSLAFGLNVSSFKYRVDKDEDGLLIRLIPRHGMKSTYSPLELIAFFRALRDNQVFVGISLSDIWMDCIADAIDHYGDNVSFK
jgi:hypothetical protein